MNALNTAFDLGNEIFLMCKFEMDACDQTISIWNVLVDIVVI